MVKVRCKICGDIGYTVALKIFSILFFSLILRPAIALTELPISSAIASSYLSGYYGPVNAIDKNLSTYWVGARSKAYWWLVLDLGNTQSLSQISIYWYKGYCSSNYSIQGSNDNIKWTNILTGLSSLGGAVNPYQKDHNLSGTYRYVRIYIYKAQYIYPVVYEVKLFGGTADTSPPTGSIKINNGTQYTNSTGITLTLSAQDSGSGMGAGAQMQFSNDNTTYSIPEAYNTTKAWTLTTGDGAKTVYVKFKDVAGNWSVPYSTSIILDATKPLITITVPQNGAVITDN